MRQSPSNDLEPTVTLFSKLVVKATASTNVPFGWIVKEKLSYTLRQRYSEAVDKLIPTGDAWVEYLIDASNHISFRIPLRVRRDKDATYVQEMLNTWRKKSTNRWGRLDNIESKIGFASYYYAHICGDESLKIAASEIDRVIIGATFEQMFRSEVPTDFDSANSLLCAFDARQSGQFQFNRYGIGPDILEGAIIARDQHLIENLLIQGVDIEDDSIAYGSALELLLCEREPDEDEIILELMDLFFKYGADINQICTHGSSLAHQVAYLDDVCLLSYLLQKRIEVNHQDSWDGKTALASAASFGAERAVALLLEYDADPNIPDEGGWTPLIKACSRLDMGYSRDEGEEDRRIRICNKLLKYGAILSASTKTGKTAAVEAEENEFLRLHEFLVRWPSRHSV